MTRVVVAGTGTEVGKTHVTAALARCLRDAGIGVSARKPVQSFTRGDDEAERTDAQILGAATSLEPTAVCPSHRWYSVAMAPPMAADALGCPPFTISDLVAETPDPGDDVQLVELAGGIRSPVASDGDCLDLLTALRPRLVVLVADAGLGTINLVRLCCALLPADRTSVFLNRFDVRDGLHARNRDWLRTRGGAAGAIDVEALAGTVRSALQQTGR